MDKTLKIYLAVIFGVIVLMVYIDQARTKPLDWSPTYSLDNKNPLDLYVFNHEVVNIFPKNKLKRVRITPFQYIRENKGVANYLIIFPNVYDCLTDSSLLNEVKKGSNLWISAENIVNSFTESLHLEYRDVDIDTNLKQVNSVNLSLTMSNWSNKFVSLHPVFNAFAFVKLDSSRTTILGKMEMPNGELFPNYIRVKYGKGFIYLHNQPAVFSNVAMLGKSGTADYVAHIFSYIPQDKPLVWFVQNQTQNTDEPVNESELSVIFRYPALRATWLLFIYGVLLYLLFNAKRRQRIIPVIKPLKNTTVEFVQTIGNLYFQEGRTANLLEKKIIYFLDKVRHRYYLDTSKLDESFAEKLQSKSGKDRELIDELLSCIKDFYKLKTAVQTDLIKLNRLIEEFWK